jgi:hypothetical protein
VQEERVPDGSSAGAGRASCRRMNQRAQAQTQHYCSQNQPVGKTRHGCAVRVWEVEVGMWGTQHKQPCSSLTTPSPLPSTKHATFCLVGA